MRRLSARLSPWGARGTLVAGDNDGELAVWDVPAAR